MFKNPTVTEFLEAKNKRIAYQRTPEGSVRGIIVDDDIYIWNGEDALHHEVISTLVKNNPSLSHIERAGVITFSVEFQEDKKLIITVRYYRDISIVKANTKLDNIFDRLRKVGYTTRYTAE